MQSDISITKSRAFNSFIRFLQLALGIMATIFISYFVQTHCVNQHFILLTYLGIAATLISIFGIILMKCSDQHPKVGFLILFIIDLGLMGTIGTLSALDFNKSYGCAMTNPIYKYYIVAITFTLVVIFMTLFFPFYWIQRYSNSPGNLVWPFVMVVDWPWRGNLTYVIVILMLLSVGASLFTFIANWFAMWKGITVFVKKLVVVCWFGGWLLVILLQVGSVGIYVLQYMNRADQDYNELVSKTIIQMVIMINLIDLIFWQFGYISLRYENGDSIRDGLINYGKNSEFDESQAGDYNMKKQMDRAL